MSMNVLIFTEAGKNYGYGHLIRCLAIAHGFKERNIPVHFFVRGDVDCSKILLDFPFEIDEWLTVDFIKASINSHTIAVVDSYYADRELCEFIYESAFKVLFLDDYKRLDYPGGYVLNGAIGAEHLGYPENGKITYLLGASYQPLRKEFWEAKEFKVRGEIKKILVTFGGSDPTHQTVKYMNEIRSRFPRCHLNIVIGPGFDDVNISDITNNCDNLCFLCLNPDLKDFILLMLESDVVISAAGQTLNELARLGVPTYAVKIADNQKVLKSNWHKANFLLESLESPDLSKEVRQNSSFHGKLNIDGLGVKRVVKSLL